MTVWNRPEAAADGADRVFERLVSEKLRALGWTCEVLQTSAQFGADMICTCKGEKLLVQCAPGAVIDISELQHVAALKAYHAAGTALMVHDGVPSPEAEGRAEQMGVVLVHADALSVAGAYDRSDYGVRLRLERELALEQEQRARRETADRVALMTYYEAVNQYEQDSKAWQAARRRRPWLKSVGVASIAPPFLLLGSPYFLFFLLLSLALAICALFLTKPGAAPVAPAPLKDLTPRDILPDRATAPFAPRPAADARTGVPAPAVLARTGRPRQPAARAELKSIVACPKCRTKMRLPRGRRVWANCPSCKNRFRADT